MPDNCNDCPLVPRVAALEAANKNYDRINEGVIDRLGKLEAENAVQNVQYSTISRKLDEHTAMLTELTGRPGKRWDSISDKVIWLLLEAVLIVAAVKIGLM